MLCSGSFVWLLPPSCVSMAWFGTQSTMVTEKRRTQSVKTAPTVQTSPGLMGKAQKVLKTAHPSIPATARATLPEEGTDIPSRKSPTEWERNEKSLAHRRCPGECLELRGEWCGPPRAEGKHAVPSGRGEGARGSLLESMSLASRRPGHPGQLIARDPLPAGGLFQLQHLACGPWQACGAVAGGGLPPRRPGQRCVGVSCGRGARRWVFAAHLDLRPAFIFRNLPLPLGRWVQVQAPIVSFILSS